MRGFTLIELLVTIAVLILLAALAIPQIRTFQRQSALETEANQILGTLRLAQSRSQGTEGGNSFGVHFDQPGAQYILFQGASFATRDPAEDEVHALSSFLRFSAIGFSGGEEVVFDRVDGTTEQPGSVQIELESDPAKTRTVYVEASGKTGSASPGSPSDADRQKDSRHVHVDYVRSIDTGSETMTLTFAEGTPEETPVTIEIASFLQGGQIFWNDTTEVGGEDQSITLRTHRLNNPDTQFSVRRDRRENTKALTIDISGDSSGTIIQYDEDGQTTQGTSIHAAAPDWQ